MKRVVVVGAGIAGLATALHLKDRSAEVPGGLDVLVLEAGERVGGNICTRRVRDFRIEEGPNGFLDSVPATLALVKRLGLEDRLQQADERAARRFLYRKGKLHRLPSGPLSFLKSPLLSPGGRLRVLMEPFATSKQDGTDETIFDFGSRRIGPEATSVLIDAMVSGVFAGDIRALSLASSFPRMAEMEAAHGSLVKAMLARGRERREARKRIREARRRGEDVPALTRPGGPAGPRGTLTSFREGLDVLPHALAGVLGDAVRLRCPVTALAYGPHPQAGGRWQVTAARQDPVPTDAVVLALPAPQAAPLLKPLDPDLAATVGAIPTAGLAVVALAFDERALGETPTGFGFLAPRGEGLRLLGCLWDSSIFPGRAPRHHVLLRVMIGGAHDPEAVSLDEDLLVRTVRRELALAMNVTAEPAFVQVYRYPLGIAQYTVGHGQRLDRIHGRLEDLPGLWVAGSSYYGVSMNACVEKAAEQADAVLHFLTPS